MVLVAISINVSVKWSIMHVLFGFWTSSLSQSFKINPVGLISFRTGRSVVVMTRLKNIYYDREMVTATKIVMDFMCSPCSLKDQLE